MNTKYLSSGNVTEVEIGDLMEYHGYAGLVKHIDRNTDGSIFELELHNGMTIRPTDPHFAAIHWTKGIHPTPKPIETDTTREIVLTSLQLMQMFIEHIVALNANIESTTVNRADPTELRTYTFKKPGYKGQVADCKTNEEFYTDGEIEIKVQLSWGYQVEIFFRAESDGAYSTIARNYMDAFEGKWCWTGPDCSDPKDMNSTLARFMQWYELPEPYDPTDGICPC